MFIFDLVLDHAILNTSNYLTTMNDNWAEQKKKHLVLSQSFADKYEEEYSESNFATGSYMAFELLTIEKFIKECPSRYLAVDLGCGEGRDTFFLAKHFEQVFGYDFASNMIKNAVKNKFKKSIGNVLFEVKDVEDGLKEFDENSVPLVNSAFGMGSFVRDIDKLADEIHRILMPHGIVLFCFYNRNALLNTLNLEWKPAISARLDANDKNILNVELPDGKTHSIGVRSYDVKEIKQKLERVFEIIEISTFPSLSSLFPVDLFKNVTARELCSNVDHLLSNNLDIAAGPYIVVICRKQGNLLKESQLKGYEKVLYLLRNHRIDPTIREHEPARDRNDIQRVLPEAVLDEMLFSQLVTIIEPHQAKVKLSRLGGRHILIGVPGDRKIDFGKLATFLGVKRSSLASTEPSIVKELTGFEPGSIPMFAMPKRIPIIIDEKILSKKFFWSGTGKETESIRLSLDDYKLLSAFTKADISKPR